MSGTVSMIMIFVCHMQKTYWLTVMSFRKNNLEHCQCIPSGWYVKISTSIRRKKKACENTGVSTPTAWPKLFLTLSSKHWLNSSQKLFAAFSDWIHHRYCFECGRATPTQDEAQGTTRSCLQAREAGKTTILNAIQPHVDQSHSKKCDAPKQYQHHTWIVRALCQHLKWNALD